jgi:site-specific recombinase XerD
MEITPTNNFPSAPIATQSLTVLGGVKDSDLATLASSSPVAAYVRSLTTNASRSGMQQCLIRVADILAPGFLPPSKGRGRGSNGAARFAKVCELPFHQLRTDRLSELRAELIRSGGAAASTNMAMAAVKGVLQICWKQNLMDGDSLARAKSCLNTVRGSTVPKGKQLSKLEIARMFRGIAKTGNPAASRDAALLALLCLGLRRAEVAAIRLPDLDQTSGRLIVRGKGNKERVIFLTNGSFSAVKDWITVRGTQSTDALLLQVNKGGHIVGSGITATSIYSALRKRSEDVGLTCSPHDLRRTLCGDLLNSGVDVVTVQHIFGHQSPTTTARYDRRPEETRKLAMGTITVPYVACNN